MKAILISLNEKVNGMQKLTVNPKSQLTVNSNEINKVVELTVNSESETIVNSDDDEGDEESDSEPEE